MPCPNILPLSLACKRTHNNLLDLSSSQIRITRADLDDILSQVGSESLIDNCLEKSRRVHLYSDDAKRWTTIKALESDDRLLYDAVTDLLNFILAICQSYDESHRKFINTFSSSDIHSQVDWPETEDKMIKRLPAVRSVMLDGKYFKSDNTDIDIEGLLPAYCACPIEVRRADEYTGSLIEREKPYLAQCGIYAEEILASQIGRRFVFVPLITERQLRLYRFDRGGVLVSPWIDYHDDPEVLIRIVLLTCGRSGDTIGANPDITWEGCSQYITVDRERYIVIEGKNYSNRITGRGTCIWNVEDKQGQARIVKYIWRDAPKASSLRFRDPEMELLKLVKGMKGVAQLIAHSTEESMFKIRDCNFIPEYMPQKLTDKKASFIVLEKYEDRVTNFRTATHLLYIFRDALAGHRNMWNEGIMHRDISFNNILYGSTRDPKEGFDGVVIDMDLAIFTYLDVQLPDCSPDIGTPGFESYRDLKAAFNSPPDTRTYLEDLESFMWVFLAITSAYEALPDGGSLALEHPPPEYQTLFTFDIKEAAQHKRNILKGISHLPLHHSYPPQFKTLRTQLLQFFRYYSIDRHQQRHPPITRRSLAIHAEYHYDQIIGYFNSTIHDIVTNTVRRDEDFEFSFGLEDRELIRRAKDEEELKVRMYNLHYDQFKLDRRRSVNR